MDRAGLVQSRVHSPKSQDFPLCTRDWHDTRHDRRCQCRKRRHIHLTSTSLIGSNWSQADRDVLLCVCACHHSTYSTIPRPKCSWSWREQSPSFVPDQACCWQRSETRIHFPPGDCRWRRMSTRAASLVWSSNLSRRRRRSGICMGRKWAKALETGLSISKRNHGSCFKRGWKESKRNPFILGLQWVQSKQTVNHTNLNHKVLLSQTKTNSKMSTLPFPPRPSHP